MGHGLAGASLLQQAKTNFVGASLLYKPSPTLWERACSRMMEFASKLAPTR